MWSIKPRIRFTWGLQWFIMNYIVHKYCTEFQIAYSINWLCPHCTYEDVYQKLKTHLAFFCGILNRKLHQRTGILIAFLHLHENTPQIIYIANTPETIQNQSTQTKLNWEWDLQEDPGPDPGTRSRWRRREDQQSYRKWWCFYSSGGSVK